MQELLEKSCGGYHDYDFPVPSSVSRGTLLPFRDDRSGKFIATPFRETMTRGDAIDALARRFRIERPPTLFARRSSKGRIEFSRMRSSQPRPGRSLSVPRQEAFVFHVPLALPFFTELWTAGRRRETPDFRLGYAQLVDLGDNPVVGLNIPFDTLRFYISQIALDEMAREAGIRRVNGLYAPNFGARDLVMFGLAQAIVAAMEQPGDVTAMFSDSIALAFFAHIARGYGSISADVGNARGGLAPWQLRRARDFINANLAGDPSIAQVAGVCGLSSSYFVRAFKQATGYPPHQWLIQQRIDRAKELLRGPAQELADIAQLCGFADQSHFTRVFSKSEGCSPGRWRRIQAVRR